MRDQSSISFFDIGVNLMSGSFRSRMEEVLGRAFEVGVTDLIAIASDQEESRQLYNLMDLRDPKVWVTAGIHPHQAKTFNRESLKILQDCYSSERCVAIGECGLDYNRMYSPQDVQVKAFEAQIQLAQTLNAPLYLHERDAHKDFVEILKSTHSSGFVRGVIHCFTGDITILKTYLDLGLYVGVTGWVCDERRGDDLRSALQYIPNDRLLIETDAPYLRPRTYKGPLKIKGNEPCLLPHIAEAIAQITNQQPAVIAALSAQNARRLFEL